MPGSKTAARPAASASFGASWWIAAITVAVVPLAITPGLYFFDVTPKVVVLLVGAAIAWMALALEGRLPEVRGAAGRPFWLLAGLAAAAVLATVFSRDAVVSLAGSDWRRLGLPQWLASLALAAAVSTAAGSDAARRRRFLHVWTLAGVAASLYSFAQYLGYDPLITASLYRIGEGEWQIVRPPGTLGHASYFAAFILPLAFVAASFAVGESRWNARVAWWLAAAVLALAILVSGSRGALLGSAAGAAVFIWRTPQRKPVLLAALALSFAVAIFIVSPAGQPVRSRVRWFVEDPAGGARLPLWRDSLTLVASRPLFGTGPDAFQIAFPAVESLQRARTAPDSYAESPHNLFLDVATAAGVPAAMMMGLLLAMAFWDAARRRPASEVTMTAGLPAGLAATVVAAQFIGETIGTRVILLALAALCFDIRTGAASARVRQGVAVVAVLALAAGSIISWRLARADYAMRQSANAIAARDLPSSRDWAVRAHESFPWTGTYALTYSQMVGQLYSPAASGPQNMLVCALAEEWARMALRHSLKPQVAHVHIASLNVILGQNQTAEQALRAAIAAAPSWYRPRWLLAVLLAGSGRNQEAAQQAAAALERGARRHPEIAASCLELQRLGSTQ